MRMMRVDVHGDAHQPYYDVQNYASDNLITLRSLRHAE